MATRLLEECRAKCGNDRRAELEYRIALHDPCKYRDEIEVLFAAGIMPWDERSSVCHSSYCISTTEVDGLTLLSSQSEDYLSAARGDFASFQRVKNDEMLRDVNVRFCFRLCICILSYSGCFIMSDCEGIPCHFESPGVHVSVRQSDHAQSSAAACRPRQRRGIRSAPG